MSRLIDLKELSRLLAERIDTLVPQILPAARRDGHEWRVGSLYGEAGQSLAIHRGGARKGVWCDFSSDNLKGDALDLVAHAVCGGDKKRGVAWAKAWLGIDDMDPQTFAAARKKATAAARAAGRAAAADLEKKKKAARRMWLNADPVIEHSPVDDYLLGRGIDLSALAHVPRSLRFAAECLCYENGAYYPAMLAAIAGADGKIAACHRTYLEAGTDGFRKAAGVTAKKVLGPFRGGHIALSRGAAGTPLREITADEIVILCEGIEDGLSIALACPEYRVLAAISVSNFRNIALPPAARQVMIAADNDPEHIMHNGVLRPHPARGAVAAAVEAFAEQGRDVYIVRPPTGKDFNDLLVNGGRLEVRACQ